LDVSKWKKAKEGVLTKEMATVKQEVQENITQTRWKKEKDVPVEEEPIADESQVADEEEGAEEEEIEDQTQGEGEIDEKE
jgi:DNA segregation ATPase FtsK/SpoIIIE-like protein